MISRVLNLMGAGLPARLISGLQDNPKGHWESKALVLYNDKLLRKLGGAWHQGSAVRIECLSAKSKKRISQDMMRMIVSEYRDQHLIVLKDPRICLLAKLYVKALHQAGYRVHLVVPLRHPADVSRSLRARSNWPQGKDDAVAVQLWLVHVLGAAIAAQSLPYSVVYYEEMLERPVDVARRLANEIESLCLTPEQEAHIADFVEAPGLSTSKNQKGQSPLALGEAEKTWLSALWDQLSVADQFGSDVSEEIERGLDYFGIWQESSLTRFNIFSGLKAWLHR